MTESIAVEQKGDSSFWSPWIVVLLGTPFAFLNWWRMKKKRKAAFFLVANIFVNWLTSWTEYTNGITDTDHTLFTQILLANLLIQIAFIGILVLMMSIDIRRFKKEGQVSASVKWQVIFVFWAFLAVAHFGIWAALDYGAREMGLCRFPRFQDVIYQKEFEQRTGLATLVLGRNDFSCDWVWDIESLEPTAPNGIWLLLINETNSMDEPMLTVSQSIFQYEKVTPDEFSKITEKARQLDYSEYPIEIKDPNAQFSNIHCAKSNIYTFCNLLFGYQNIITEIRLDFSGFSDEQINSLIQLVVSANSQRIQAYEEK